jgi:hypothetical protein
MTLARGTLGLLAAIAAAYAGALAGPFQFDDWWSIVDNDAVHSLPAWFDALPGIRPLLKLANTLNWLAAPAPAAFHALNIVVHGANAVLLWRLLARWLPVLAPRASRPESVAFATSLLFALHPATTEAVAYVSGRSISLAATGQLATLLALSAARDGRRGMATLAALLFAATLAVRETAVVTPLAWLLLARCAGDDWRQALAPLRGVALVLAGAVALGAATPAYRSFFGVSLQARDFGAQLLAQLDAHLYLATRPLPGLVLNIDPDLRVPAALAPRHLLLPALLVAAAVAGWRQRRTRPWLLFALGWYVLQLAPSNSLLPRLDVANDRHLYLAVVAPLLVLVLAVANAPRRMFAASIAVLALAAGLRTADRVDDYRSEIALWTATVAHSPGKARPWTNLGLARSERGDVAGAAAAWRCALSLDPDYRQAAWNLAAFAPGAVAPRPGDCAVPPAPAG